MRTRLTKPIKINAEAKNKVAKNGFQKTRAGKVTPKLGSPAPKK